MKSGELPSLRSEPQGTPSVERRVTRWEHEAVTDAMQRRMDLGPQSPIKLRRRIAELPFGTIKAWMGHTHFLMKRLKNVEPEISLHILAYDLKRVMQILAARRSSPPSGPEGISASRISQLWPHAFAASFYTASVVGGRWHASRKQTLAGRYAFRALSGRPRWPRRVMGWTPPDGICVPE